MIICTYWFFFQSYFTITCSAMVIWFMRRESTGYCLNRKLFLPPPSHWPHIGHRWMLFVSFLEKRVRIHFENMNAVRSTEVHFNFSLSWNSWKHFSVAQKENYFRICRLTFVCCQQPKWQNFLELQLLYYLCHLVLNFYSRLVILG